MDGYLKNFLDFCVKQLGKNLEAMTIYGSYGGKNFNKDRSDYDIFIIVKNKKGEKRFRKIVKSKFKKISLQYFATIKELSDKIKEGNWAIFIALVYTGKVIYSNKRFSSFINKTRKNGINARKSLGRYVGGRNQEEFNIAKKLTGWKFIKWVYASMRKRLYLISYSRFSKSKFNFLADLKSNKDLFSTKEILLLKNLNKKYNNRAHKINSDERRLYLSILKRTNEIIKQSNEIDISSFHFKYQMKASRQG